MTLPRIEQAAAALLCAAWTASLAACCAQPQASPAHPRLARSGGPGTTVTLRGRPVHTVGKLPAVGSQAPAFTLVKTDLSEVRLADLRGKRVILNIFVSVDTPTCAKSVRTFNADAARLKDTVVLCVSKDLPFAQKRFCGAEGLAHVVSASAFRSDFGRTYGVTFADGPLRGLLSRAVVVIGPAGKVLYTQQVPEVSHQPDYARALAALR